MDLPATTARLPRGPHGLTRAEVLRSQRGRLFLAMLDAVADRGYQPVTVAHVVAKARISRRTFYELFDSKEDCFAASFEAGVELMETRLNDAVRSAGRLDWRELVRTSLKAYLDILTEEPALAYVMHVEALIAGPALAGYRRRFSAMFADRMRAARNLAVRSGELTGELPSEIFNFIIGGIDDRIRDCLQQRGPSALQELEPTLTYVALTLLDTEPTGPAARIGKNWAR